MVEPQPSKLMVRVRFPLPAPVERIEKMKPLQNVYLCGLGALGGMYASRLHAAAVENVKVIADPERMQRYRERGITVNGTRLPLSFV